MIFEIIATSIGSGVAVFIGSRWAIKKMVHGTINPPNLGIDQRDYEKLIENSTQSQITTSFKNEEPHPKKNMLNVLFECERCEDGKKYSRYYQHITRRLVMDLEDRKEEVGDFQEEHLKHLRRSSQYRIDLHLMEPLFGIHPTDVDGAVFNTMICPHCERSDKIEISHDKWKWLDNEPAFVKLQDNESVEWVLKGHEALKKAIEEKEETESFLKYHKMGVTVEEAAESFAAISKNYREHEQWQKFAGGSNVTTITVDGRAAEQRVNTMIGDQAVVVKRVDGQVYVANLHGDGNRVWVKTTVNELMELKMRGGGNIETQKISTGSINGSFYFK